VSTGFAPPVYPFDRLAGLAGAAAALPGGMVDLSAGSPTDPPPPGVVAALSASASERGYPSATGSPAVLEAAAAWVGRRFGVELELGQLALCVGTKEFVAGLPHWLRLRSPGRDTVLHPALAYPTYEMGATLAGCRAVGVPAAPSGGLDLSAVGEEDAARALCLWVNSPANPDGSLTDLAAAAAWGRERGVPIVSDECYAEFTWSGRPRTVLEHGSDGVLALHSISKRSNCAGLRLGFYAGDPDLVSYLAELRRHAGLMVPGPVQAAAAVALSDDAHVEAQRARYRERLELLVAALGAAGLAARPPDGSFYLWLPAGGETAPAWVRALPGGDEGEGDDWRLARFLAERAGALVSPGEFYGEPGRGFVRLAVVQPTERIALVGRRLAAALAAEPAASGTS